MLVSLNQILPLARQNGYAIGAFNINNLEFLQAVLAAAKETKSAVIVQTTEGALDYAGLEYLVAMVRAGLKNHPYPVVFHLDHGRDFNLIKKIIKSGCYSSVMFDGSTLPFEENVKKTREIVKLARKNHLSVEAELGVLKGIEGLTDPRQAAEFVKKTNCDALAVAIGTSHGAYKFSGQPKLDFERLSAIAKLVKIPLVLHGASSVSQRQGLPGAQGVPDIQIRQAIKLGVAKINIDTDLRIAFTAAIRKKICADQKIIDPREYLGAGREAVKNVVKEKILLFSK